MSDKQKVFTRDDFKQIKDLQLNKHFTLDTIQRQTRWAESIVRRAMASPTWAAYRSRLYRMRRQLGQVRADAIAIEQNSTPQLMDSPNRFQVKGPLKGVSTIDNKDYVDIWIVGFAVLFIVGMVVAGILGLISTVRDAF